MSDEIARKHAPSKHVMQNKLDLTKKSYQFFIKKIISLELKRNTIKKDDVKKRSLLTEKEINKKVAILTIDYNSCLDYANNNRSIKDCTAKFIESIPYRLSKHVMIEKLRDKILHIYGDDNQGLLKIFNASERGLNNCVIKWYKHPSGNGFLEVNKAKACVYEGIMDMFKLASVDGVKKAAIRYLPKSSQQERKDFIKNSLSERYNCKIGKLIEKSGRFATDDYKLLTKMSPDDFVAKLGDCISSLSIKAGRNITENILGNVETISINFENDKKIKDRMVKDILENGYDKCVAISGTPVVCELYIKSKALRTTGKEILRKKLDEILPSVKSNEKDGILNRTNKIIDDCMVHVDIIHENGIIERNVDQKDIEQKIVNCFSQGIGTFVFEIIAPVIKNELTKNKLTRKHGIKLSEESLNSQRNKIKKCFLKKLKNVSEMMKLGQNVKSATEQCSMEAKRNVVLEIIKPLLLKVTDGNFEDKKDQQMILDSFLESSGKKHGLYSRLQNAANSNELNSVIVQVQPQVIERIFSYSSGPANIFNAFNVAIRTEMESLSKKTRTGSI